MLVWFGGFEFIDACMGGIIGNMNTAVDLHIEGMTCAACSSRIERVLSRMPGVNAQVSLLEHRARIIGLSSDEAIAAIRRAGYDAWPIFEQSQRQTKSPSQTAKPLEQFRNLFSALALGVMVIEMIGMLTQRHGLIAWPIQLFIATVMQTVVAWPFYRSAARAIRSKSANMETLISLGTVCAYGWSVFLLFFSNNHHGVLYFEASVVVIAMVRLGRVLQERAQGRALEAIEGLIHLETKEVDCWDEASLSWKKADPREISEGARIRIHPNESLSLDGVVLEGSSEVDESSMTGESMPANRSVGMNVYAGCTNLTGVLIIKTSSGFHASRRALIGARILSALSTRAPIAALADRIAHYFVPAVLVIAALTLAAHFWAGSQASHAIAAAVAVLVVACPCALGLATPAAIAAGLARAAREGWLFQSADSLQRAASVNTVVFDKTGTLTSGRPRIKDIWQSDRSILGGWPYWLSAAAAAERGVEHPLAGALLSYASGKSIPDAKDIENIAGQGVRAQVLDASGNKHLQVCVGKPQWVMTQLDPAKNLDPAKKIDPSQDAPSTAVKGLEGTSEIHVAIDGVLEGKIFIADSLKQDAAQTITSLIDRGYHTRILSGDRNSAVKVIAQELGNISYDAEQTPEEKTAKIRAWKSQGEKIAMVGDGINDAAAMSHADLGIAMAAGANLTIEAADLTIADASRLCAITESLSLAKETMRRVKENLAFAFMFNILAIPAAALGKLSPAIAGSAMAASSVLVMANALRLLRLNKDSQK